MFETISLFAASQSSNPVPVLIVLIFFITIAIGYFFGRSHGYRDGRESERFSLSIRQLELDNTKKNLDKRETTINEHEQEAIARAENTLKHATELEKAATKKLQDAEDRFKCAYQYGLEEKEHLLHEYEQQIRAIAQTCVSSHPNNAYIAEVWNGTVEAIMNDTLKDLEWRAEKTAARMEKKFNQSARQWQYDAKYYKLQTLLYESLFPELLKFSDGDPSADAQPIPPEKTTEKDWLSPDEYARLTSREKSQLALDRYIASHGKSRWQIGRDYELYIGYCYRRKKFKVEHVGMEKKLSDLGRDLVCCKPLDSRIETHIVQCKCWSSEKLIHEKHVTQLFGTTVEYAFAHHIDLENGRLPQRLKPVLITSTSLSDTARRFADALGVEYHENISLPQDPNSFPRIKCNKSSGIYHLPFDEQYDVTKIIPSEGDCFVFSVSEAESKGFRRAMRHYL